MQVRVMSLRLFTVSAILLMLTGCAANPSATYNTYYTVPHCEQSIVVTRIVSRWDASTGELSRSVESEPPQCVQPAAWQTRRYSFTDELAAQLVVGFVRGMVEVVVRAAFNAH